MRSGKILARSYDTGTFVRLAWQDGLISGLEPTEPAETCEDWIAPALFDPQVNGYAGVDFQGEPPSAVQLAHAVAELHRAGCTRFLLTLITDDWPRLLERLRHLKALRESSPSLSAAIAGWHVEGPFLSAEPGFHGAHDPRCMLDPTPQRFAALRDAVGADPLLVTLAPERAGAIESIRAARPLGIVISLGHTNATSDQIESAVAAGATGFTHLGNACPRELDRHDNILWRVLDTGGLTVSLIPDAIHVSPAPFRLFHRWLPDDSVIYTTDAMAAAGAPPGRYPLGKLELEVGTDQIVRQPGRSNFAGSALRPIDGVRRASQMLGRRWQEVWDGFSVRPSQFMGCLTALAPGQRADFCVLRSTPDGQISRVRTFCAGQECV